MLLAVKEFEGYRPIMVVQSMTTTANNTTLLIGVPDPGNCQDNAPENSFLLLTQPLAGITMEWDQMRAFYINPTQGFDIRMDGKIPFPFVLYKMAMVTLISVRPIVGVSLGVQMEFQENPFPLFIDDPPPWMNGNADNFGDDAWF
jgi:hypothetical protein